MRVAVVHDWLTDLGGAERVLEVILEQYPEADLYVTVDFLPAVYRTFLKGKAPRTTFVQRLPFARKHYRKYIALFPIAVEQFDLSDYDLVISSSYAVAKGVLTGPDQVHVSYIHSPMRYAWDLQHAYLRDANMARGVSSFIARCMLHYLRIWDSRTGNGPDLLLANSNFIARRIRKNYGRLATVVYPPVDLAHLPFRETKEGFYMTASRHVPYKRIPLIVEAFRSMPERRLIVFGDGPDLDKAKAKAETAPNIEFMGFQSRAVLTDYMSRAKAFVFAAEEDFGIVSVEAQACGTPVIALGKGGSLEIIRGLDTPAPTGVLFPEATRQAICIAVDQFELASQRILPGQCRDNASRFSTERFVVGLKSAVDRAFRETGQGPVRPAIVA